jgi:hypothetical protein
MKIDYVRGSNVVSLAAQRAEQVFPALREVEAYWEGLRNGRPVPTRADIDPRGMQSALEYAFILERIAPGIARFRLAGMHLTDLMGMEVRGMPLTAMFVPDSRAKISEALEAVCETPQVTIVTLQGERSIGRGHIEAQLLLCPLKSDLGDVTRILGCLQSNGEIGRQPRRFEITDISTRPLLSSDSFAAGSQSAAKETPPSVNEMIEGTTNPTPGSNKEGYTAKGTPIPAGFAEARKAYLEQQKETVKVEAASQSKNKTPSQKKAPFLRLVKTDN